MARRSRLVNFENKGKKCLMCGRNALCKGYCRIHYMIARKPVEETQ